MTCAESGCGGVLVAGYCDTCGTAPRTWTGDGAADSTAAMPVTAPTGRTGGTASVRSGHRGRLGAGIVAIPPVRRGDPAAAVLADPRVPESQRFCGNPDCNRPVGRERHGNPGRAEGFCTSCGTRYSFVPRLSRGDLVGGQYEVQGCIAHGGLGWIYLAIDRNVHNRWVVLKGLVNSGDAGAMAAAAAEAQALAEVEHPNIVRIYNFVQHVDSTGLPVGYIVMEYVGGRSLKEIRKAREAPLPPDQAVAYIIEIAPALGYLHELGLAYCDFKPDNVMQTDEQLKLIDLGAVVDMDHDGPIYGTRGYQAPEIPWTGPTVASDIYTVGRALAVLVMDLPRENGCLAAELPAPEAVPVLAEHESLYRAILRATAIDPQQRFSSMDDLTDQLTGVLHEIAAADSGTPHPRVSTHFSPQRAVFGTDRETTLAATAVITALGVPKVDAADPGAALLATTSGTPPAQLEQALHDAIGGSHDRRSTSIEIPLRLVRAALELGAVEEARKRLADLQHVTARDWRLTWYSGQCALLEGDFDQAAKDFDAVLATLPGELDPKLALAATAELRCAPEDAARYYETVWRTNHRYYSAAFGLARHRARAGNRVGAIATLDEIPPSSAHFTAAGTAALEIVLDGRSPEHLDEATLIDAAARASALFLESTSRRAMIRLKVFGAALAWLRAGNHPAAKRLLDTDFREVPIRVGMEQCLRALGHESPDMWERIRFVEEANKIRPRTRL